MIYLPDRQRGLAFLFSWIALDCCELNLVCDFTLKQRGTSMVKLSRAPISNVRSFSCRMPINFCSQCGEKLQATFRFCPSCGEKLPSLPLTVSVSPASPGQTTTRSDGTTLNNTPVQATKRKSNFVICHFLCLVMQETCTRGSKLWVT